MISDIIELLRGNPYPGRGIIIGCSRCGQKSIVVYFIMGRSVNSRNRIFEQTRDGIRTAAYDPAKLTDPSLVIYNPVRIMNDCIVVTNGDQTDTIYDYINDGSDFYNALQSREFEPDAPNYTPRISGLVQMDGSYHLSILKTVSSIPIACQRNFYEYSSAIPGLGHFISTYETDGDPLPSFSGDPIPIYIDDSIGLKGFLSNIWDALDDENKVSIYAHERDLSTGEINHLVFNHPCREFPDLF